MLENNTASNEENKGVSRRLVVQGAAWSVPVIAAAVATPLAAASGPTPDPTIVNVLTQPSPLVGGQVGRLTYRGDTGAPDFQIVPFPAGSYVTITVAGDFSSVTWSGVDLAGAAPTWTGPITDLNSFYIQGSGTTGSTVTTTVYRADNTEIGHATSTFE